MPKIIGLTEQQSALREISAAVKKMDGINDFLNTPNLEGKYTISFEAEGKRHQTILTCMDKQLIDRFAQDYKNGIVSTMVKLAEDHRIALDPSDKAAFGID